MNSLRILLVEPDVDDAQFLLGAINETGENRLWDEWLVVTALHTPTLDEAALALRAEPVDVILLALTGDAVASFHSLTALAPHVPVVLLSTNEDILICRRLLREGAQDFVVKSGIDCEPLAHALRTAVERHRYLASLRCRATLDTLTGLPNAAGFLAAAERDRHLAAALNRRMLLALAEPVDLAAIAASFGPDRIDLTMIEAADRLRELLSPYDLLARVEERRFAMLLFETETGSLEESSAAIRSHASKARIRTGFAIFAPDESTPVDRLLESAARDLASCDLQPLTLAMRQ